MHATRSALSAIGNTTPDNDAITPEADLDIVDADRMRTESNRIQVGLADYQIPDPIGALLRGVCLSTGWLSTYYKQTETGDARDRGGFEQLVFISILDGFPRALLPVVT